jgi:excisionase family DNA binding protein
MVEALRDPEVRDELRSILQEASPAPGPDPLLTVAEAAQYAKVAETTVRGWITEGKLRASQAGRRWRIRQGDIDACMESKVEPTIDIDEEAQRILARVGRR